MDVVEFQESMKAAAEEFRDIAPYVGKVQVWRERERERERG